MPAMCVERGFVGGCMRRGSERWNEEVENEGGSEKEGI